MLSRVVDKTLLEPTNVLELLLSAAFASFEGRLVLGLLVSTRVCRQASKIKKKR
jgi:hypothetical protein